VTCIRDLKIRSDITTKIATPLQITIGVVLFRIIVRFIPRIVHNPQIHCTGDFFKLSFRAFLEQCTQLITPTKCTVLNTYEHASELRV
jgi:hypothetical protein